MPPSNIQAYVLPVALQEACGVIRSIGTAFHIGYGLAVTAAHVVDHAIEREGVLEGPSRLGVIWTGMRDQELNPTGPLPLSWLSIESVTTLPGCDLAVLTIQVPFRGDVPLIGALRLGFCPPDIGTDTVALGYTRYTGTASDANFNVDLKVTQGRVEEVFPVKHSSLKPFPAFQTDARYDPGMSGGPVFAEHGVVVGAVCSSLAGNEEERHTSFSSLLTPLLGVAIPWEGGQAVDLLQLVKQGFIYSDGSADNAVLKVLDDGNRALRWL